MSVVGDVVTGGRGRERGLVIGNGSGCSGVVAHEKSRSRSRVSLATSYHCPQARQGAITIYCSSGDTVVVRACGTREDGQGMMTCNKLSHSSLRSLSSEDGGGNAVFI